MIHPYEHPLDAQAPATRKIVITATYHTSYTIEIDSALSDAEVQEAIYDADEQYEPNDQPILQGSEARYDDTDELIDEW